MTDADFASPVSAFEVGTVIHTPVAGEVVPRRIQRSRARGWRMPEGAIYVGRPTKWGNDYRPLGRCWHHGRNEFVLVRDVAHAVQLYREEWEFFLARESVWPLGIFEPLRGHDLACWCPLDQNCHADILIEFANRPTTERCQTAQAAMSNTDAKSENNIAVLQLVTLPNGDA